MVIAPPASIGSTWSKKFGTYEEAHVSGWMAVRGMKKRRNLDHGFVLSDHADWDGLNTAISATGAENIYVTHGYTEIFAKWLSEQGYNAHVVKTEFGDDLADINETP
jgi:putative mRNA 3-end processing factor